MQHTEDVTESTAVLQAPCDSSRSENQSFSSYSGAVITSLPVIAPLPCASIGVKTATTPAPSSDCETVRVCGGVLRDTVLDWDDGLPAVDLERAEGYCKRATLHLVLGSSLQVSLSLPDNNGRVNVFHLTVGGREARTMGSYNHCTTYPFGRLSRRISFHS